MKLNKVNTSNQNSALVSLIQDSNQILPVDANFFIAFDRSKLSSSLRPIDFITFQKMWINPLLSTFPNLSIHESVYDEITVNYSAQKFIDKQIGKYQQPLLLSDSELDENGEIVRASIEKKIAKYTRYEPEKDNADNRGEVKSLAYIATKGLLYFCSHDSNALKLIEKASEWDTNLESVNAIRTYEILYYLLKAKATSKDVVRFLYKYLYYSTKSDKAVNPEWGIFINEMDNLYDELISTCPDFPDISAVQVNP
ncbi:hypothetical protein ACQYAD_02605 [Neobacillus sp. SM06]|uniref:hypothetical protein n=1 Tax=Neobacillus sp. SM06 TaxID=3422492 RepID=UPI003D27C73D